MLIVLVAVFALILVVAIVGLLVFFLGGDSSNKETSETETNESEEASDEDEDEDEDESEDEEGDEGDGEDGGEDDGSDDEDGDEENVDSPPEEADDTADTQESDTKLDALKQNVQKLRDVAATAGLNEADLQSFNRGIEGFINLFENNRDAVASLSEEEARAWLEELEAQDSLFTERWVGCRDLLDSASSSDEEALGCMQGTLNGYGQALTLINQKYGLID